MDNNYSAAIVPGTSNKYWTCFAFGARGDIFKAVEYKEGIHGFYEKLKFISGKYIALSNLRRFKMKLNRFITTKTLRENYFIKS